MSSKILFLGGALIVLVIYGVSVAILLTTPGNNSIPTPGRAVVAGIIAMFCTLLVFTLGFIKTATITQD